MTDTFDQRIRRTDTYTVKKRTTNEKRSTIHTTDATGFSLPNEQLEGIDVGIEFELETVNWSTITGIRLGGTGVFRKSDQTLKAEHEEMIAGFARERADRLAANRADWERREAALPEWVRVRLEAFRASGGESYELEGWGYELIVAELAAAYVTSRLVDDDTINAISSANGTSGNQHDMAKALAKAHIDGQDLAGTVSALSPITGDGDYSKAGQ